MNDQPKTHQEQPPRFSPPEDLLDREAVVTTLSNLLFSDAVKMDGSSPEETIAVCGGWGTGKTWFVQTWCEQLKKNDLARVVFLSAWEDDSGDDPIATLLQQAEIDLAGERSNSKKIGSWFRRNRSVLHLLGTAVGSRRGGAIVELTLGKRKETLASLRNLLIEIGKPSPNQHGKLLPLIVFVDELDRCRPLHAIAMLERIKHIFQMQGVGITFILSIDKTNLKRSIQSVYGQIDADDYLRRFFTFEYHLPRISSTRFVTSLFSEERLPPASDVVPTLLLASNRSLRSMERVATGVKLVMKSGVLIDAFNVVKHGELLDTAAELYSGRSELGDTPSNIEDIRSSIHEACISGNYRTAYTQHETNSDKKNAKANIEKFFSYQDESNLSLLIQDFVWGITTSSIMLKLDDRRLPEYDLSRIEAETEEITTSWRIDSAEGLVEDRARVLQTERRAACGDEYYASMLRWISSMAVYCAKLIESNIDVWLAKKGAGHGLEKEVWQSAKQYFVDNSSGIEISTRSDVRIDAGKWFEYHEGTAGNYYSTPRNTTEAEADLTKVRRDLSLRALAAASVATDEVCRVLSDNPELLGVITGNHQDELDRDT